MSAVRIPVIYRTLGIALACGARLVAAQEDCTSRLPASAFTRATVYLEAEAIDTTGRRMLPHVDLLTQSVASRLRQLLGGDDQRIPTADSVIDWQRVHASMLLTVYPDGRFAWRRDPVPIIRDSTSRPSRDTTSRPSRALIERALTVTHDSGERVFSPEGSIRDSMSFRLSYTYPVITKPGQVEPLRVRLAFPVFTLPLPWMTPAIAIRNPRVRYPSGAKEGGAQGSILLQFIVDTSGRADMRTVRDLWPSSRPRLTGELARHYQNFVAAAIDALEDTRFEPARVGGCPIRQLVQLPFAFQLRM